jgi:uncharacterized protein YjeT (DUF2065 family)
MPQQTRRSVARALRLDSNSLAQSGLALVLAYSVMYVVSLV